jgi:hypothetical protein
MERERTGVTVKKTCFMSQYPRPRICSTSQLEYSSRICTAVEKCHTSSLRLNRFCLCLATRNSLPISLSVLYPLHSFCLSYFYLCMTCLNSCGFHWYLYLCTGLSFATQFCSQILFISLHLQFGFWTK